MGRILLGVIAGLLTTNAAFADEAASPSEPPPAPARPSRIHHAPPAVAQANEPLALEVALEAPEKVKKAMLVYRRGGAGEELASVPFERASSSDKPYVAIVPAEDVRVPTLAYAIEVETTEGARLTAFASRQDMHTVALREDAGDARERALLARFGGRRTTLAASADYVNFGTTPSVVNGNPNVVSDQFYRLEGQFTHRLFRTVAEFGFRGGIVRGSSPVPEATSRAQQEVGMNYGAPRVRLRGADWLHLDVEGLTSVNEVGYSIGGGGAVHLGDVYGTHLTLGFEGIRIFGVRGYTRFEVALARRVSLGTLIELTNQPHADSLGVRLVADVKVDIGGGFSVGARGGYQARSFASGGLAAGFTVGYSF